MAKIIGPLMSVSAHGTIGSRLTFSSRKTGQQVRFQNRQVDVKSVAQEAQRSDFLKAVAGWHDLTESQQQEFENRSKELFLNMTGYNLFILEVLTGVVIVGNKIQSSDGKTYIITNDDHTIEMIQNEIKTLEMHDSGIIDLIKQSGCRVYLSADQTIGNNSYTKVEFDTKEYDTQNEFDSVTHYRFTATKAGKYLVGGTINFKANAIGYRLAGIYKNGAIQAKNFIKESNPADTTLFMPIQAAVLDLDVNDYIEIFTRQNSGGDLDVNSYGTVVNINKIQ